MIKSVLKNSCFKHLLFSCIFVAGKKIIFRCNYFSNSLSLKYKIHFLTIMIPCYSFLCNDTFFLEDSISRMCRICAYSLRELLLAIRNCKIKLVRNPLTKSSANSCHESGKYFYFGLFPKFAEEFEKLCWKNEGGFRTRTPRV